MLTLSSVIRLFEQSHTKAQSLTFNTNCKPSMQMLHYKNNLEVVQCNKGKQLFKLVIYIQVAAYNK